MAWTTLAPAVSGSFLCLHAPIHPPKQHQASPIESIHKQWSGLFPPTGEFERLFLVLPMEEDSLATTEVLSSLSQALANLVLGDNKIRAE
jgi:hypothetical protein